MNKIFKTISLLVALLMLSLPLALAGSAAPSKAAEKAAAKARLEIWRDLNSGAIGSAAIAITDGGNIVYSEGFGMADREQSIPVDNHTIFNIGSVSKVYVATAIMILVDEGKVDLDKPVTHYLPEFTMADERFREITVRMTLNHTSGIPGTSGANNFGYAYNPDVYRDTLAAIAQSNLKHRPGELAAYSNDGFTLAEMIVVKVSGKPFAQFLEDRIFRPLALHHTGPSVGQRPEAKIAHYYSPGKLASEPLEVLSVLGAGALSATAEDLCRFADTFSGKSVQILSPQALRELKQEQPAQFHGKLRNPDISWGLGWDVTNLDPYQSQGIQVLGKGGNSGTYTAQVYTAPAARVSVAIVSTGRSGGALSIADKVLSAYLAEKGVLKITTEAIKGPLKAQPIPAELKAFEGYYSNGLSLARLALDTEQGTLISFIVEGKTEVPQKPQIYHGGYFHSGDRKSYFAEYDSKQYLIQYVAPFHGDAIGIEKVIPATNPQQLAVPIDGAKWLRRNVQPYEGRWVLAEAVSTSKVIESLPGYIDFEGLKRVESPTFAAMPVSSTRDLSELRLVEQDGRMWAWSGGMLYMPADMGTILPTGKTTWNINTGGQAEWLQVAEDSALSFALPPSGRVALFSPDGIALYDSAVDSGEAFAPAGSYVLLAGKTGDSFTITARMLSN